MKKVFFFGNSPRKKCDFLFFFSGTTCIFQNRRYIIVLVYIINKLLGDINEQRL